MELCEAHDTWKKTIKGYLIQSCRNVVRTLLFCSAFLFFILNEKETTPPHQELSRFFQLNLILNLAYTRITSMSAFCLSFLPLLLPF